jgi:hypothetical protein
MSQLIKIGKSGTRHRHIKNLINELIRNAQLKIPESSTLDASTLIEIKRNDSTRWSQKSHPTKNNNKTDVNPKFAFPKMADPLLTNFAHLQIDAVFIWKLSLRHLRLRGAAS